MSGMDRLTDEALITGWDNLKDNLPSDGHDAAEALFDYGDKLADALSRRASQAAPAPSEPVALTYTNWQGKTAQRTITPVRVWFGSTPWHPEPQWLLTAVDVEKGLERDFALKDFGAPAPSDGLREALERAEADKRTYRTMLEQAEDDLTAASHAVPELVEALERIRDGRGICSTCGTWAVGEGGGYTACDCAYPNWDLPDPSAIANAALTPAPAQEVKP